MRNDKFGVLCYKVAVLLRRLQQRMSDTVLNIAGTTERFLKLTFPLIVSNTAIQSPVSKTFLNVPFVTKFKELNSDLRKGQLLNHDAGNEKKTSRFFISELHSDLPKTFDSIC